MQVRRPTQAQGHVITAGGRRCLQVTHGGETPLTVECSRGLLSHICRACGVQFGVLPMALGHTAFAAVTLYYSMTLVPVL